MDTAGVLERWAEDGVDSNVGRLPHDCKRKNCCPGWRWCCIVRPTANGKRCGARRQNPEGRARKPDGLEVPAGDSVGEVLGVFILTEGELRSDAEDAAIGGHEKRLDVATVFAVVDLSELLPDGTILDFFGGTFEDDGFVRFFGADSNVRIADDISGFASARARAEPKGVPPPDSPNKHEMRAAIGTSGGNPVVVRFFQALKSPVPGLESTQVFRGILNGIGPMGAAGLGFDHGASFRGTELRPNCIRPGGKARDVLS